MITNKLEEKILLLGKHVIINEGDFKGVSGILKTLDTESTNAVAKNNNNQVLMTFTYDYRINCSIIVNSKNTINVPLECVSKL